MKHFSFDQLINDQVRKKTKKLQLTMMSGLTKEDRIKRRPRSPEETFLLMRSLRRHIQKIKNEGILVTNGRNWRLYL